MKPVHLTDEHRLFLQMIFDYFREHAKWPTFKYLERQFVLTHPDLDMEEIVDSLPNGLTGPVSFYSQDSEATLTVPGIYQLWDPVQELSAFVYVIGLCVEVYLRSENEKSSISSDDLKRDYPTWKEIDIRKVGVLLRGEPGIWSLFYGPGEDGSWRGEIVRDVCRFRDVKTIEQYLEKRDMLMKVPSQPAIPTSQSSVIAFTDELQLHPDIRSKCWDLYTAGKYDEAILNATKALEVAVRTKAGLANDVLGAALINKAFRPDRPILRYSKTEAEQEGMMSLLRGMIQVFKNPQSHRFVGVQNKTECLSVLLMCSNLLYVVDKTEFVG